MCTIIDIALVVLVCIEWAKTGCAWWSLVLAGVNYTAGAFAIWITIDDLLQALQEREEGDIYYKEEDYE